jgi:predicted DsbA family dithiol-disulfide isomerase
VVSGKKIKKTDLNPELQNKLYQIEKARYDQIIEIVSQDLLLRFDKQKELDEKLAVTEKNVTEEILKNFYEKNKKDIPYSYHLVKSELKKKYLSKQKDRLEKAALEKIVQKDFKLALFEPKSPSITVKTAGLPTMGSGYIEVVEFGDFTCPYCKKVAPKLKKLVENYKGRVKFVFHPYFTASKSFAKMAFCAQQKQKFWKFHDYAFKHQNSYSNMSMSTVAKFLEIESEDFRKCIYDDKTKKGLASYQKQIESLSIKSTPAFVVNGKFVRYDADLVELKRELR